MHIHKDPCESIPKPTNKHLIILMKLPNPSVKIRYSSASHAFNKYFILNKGYFLVKVKTTKFNNKLYEREDT